MENWAARLVPAGAAGEGSAVPLPSACRAGIGGVAGLDRGDAHAPAPRNIGRGMAWAYSNTQLERASKHGGWAGGSTHGARLCAEWGMLPNWSHQEWMGRSDHVDVAKQRLGAGSGHVEQGAHVAQQLDVQRARRRLASLAAATEQDGGVDQHAALGGVGLNLGRQHTGDGPCMAEGRHRSLECADCLRWR